MISSMKDIKRIRKYKRQGAWIHATGIQFTIGTISLIVGLVLVWHALGIIKDQDPIYAFYFLSHLIRLFGGLSIEHAALGLFILGALLLALAIYSYVHGCNAANLNDPKTVKAHQYWPSWYDYI